MRKIPSDYTVLSLFLILQADSLIPVVFLFDLSSASNRYDHEFVTDLLVDMDLNVSSPDLHLSQFGTINKGVWP